MARSTTSIQAEINVLETELQSAQSLLASVGSDNTQITKRRDILQSRLDYLYVMYDRASGAAPMFVRGVIHGLGRNT
jgi:hypothetical protein